MWLVDTSPTFSVDFGSASVGTVTIDITRADGTALISGGSTTDNSDGTYDYTLAVANNDQLDLLKLDWTVSSTSEVVTTYEEIVGNLLFTIDQARNRTSTGHQTPLADASKYTDADISSIRRTVTDLFEQRTGRPWVRRYCRLEMEGSGTRVQYLREGHNRTSDGRTVGGAGRFAPNPKLIAVTVGGTSVATSNFAVDGAALIRTNGAFQSGTASNPLNVVVEYEYGPDPVPSEATENGLRLAVALLVPSDISGYAQTFSAGESSMSFPQGGWAFPSRVHEWLKANKPPVVAV